jgi:hypothetical protein
MICILGITLAIVAVARSTALPGRSTTSPPKAVYFINNDKINAVVALRVNGDGTLSDGTIVATGGTGESAIKKSTNMTAGPDALFSQGAVAISGTVRKLLFLSPK